MNKEIISTDIGMEMDIVLAYRYAALLCDFLEVSTTAQRKFSTAISEISRNCLEHGKGGKISYFLVSHDSRLHLQATISDSGPGISKKVMDGIHNGSLQHLAPKGLGIINSRKLADYLDIESGPKGTRVELGVATPKRPVDVNDERIEEWKEYFAHSPSLSPYEELKKKNRQLQALTGELNNKNNDLQEAHTRLNESMESFRVIAANIPDKVWRANEKGEVEYCNDEWLRYTGASFDELKDHNWLHYLHRNDEQKVLQLLKREEGNERSFQTECRIKRHSGKYIWHLMRCEAIFNDEGKISAWLALMMDINEQKRNAMALEQVVESRTMELQKANTELIRSNNDLEQFAYVASHDLAEPIRMISSFTDLLEKRLKDHGDPDVHDFMKYISEGADRMKLLVRDLLDYSRVGRKNTNWHVVDCNEMMEIVTSYLQEKINKSGAEIQYSDLPTVRVMGSAMLQLLQNFISNSLKFSHAGRKPAIKVSADKVDGFWHFQVQDNGIGIDEKYNDRVFIIFQRLHTRDEYSGMGIGLAICKKIVDLHGGNIWYESEPGEGTIFHFTLPVETLQKKGKTEEEEEEE